MLTLVVVLFAGALFAGSLAVGFAVSDRAQVRQSLRRLEGYQIAGVRDQEMLEPLTTRGWRRSAAGWSAWRAATRRSATPRPSSARSCSPAARRATRSTACSCSKVFGAASGVLWLPLVYLLLEWGGYLALLAVGFLWAVSFLGPDLALDRKIEARQHAIRRRLPDMLDLLVISVEAGLGFEQALDRTSDRGARPDVGRVPPDAPGDPGRARAGPTRCGRSTSAPTCSELRPFILAMLQADTFGVSISRILRSQADEMRIRRRQRAQELAQQAPIKLLIPLVFCIFPAIFVVVLARR